jgi:hypothetical protein
MFQSDEKLRAAGCYIRRWDFARFQKAPWGMIEKFWNRVESAIDSGGLSHNRGSSNRTHQAHEPQQGPDTAPTAAGRPNSPSRLRRQRTVTFQPSLHYLLCIAAETRNDLVAADMTRTTGARRARGSRWMASNWPMADA